MFHIAKPIILGKPIAYVNMILCYVILNTMAVTCARPGRPRLVADIDFSEDTDLAFWDVFYSICANFHYAEVMALSRALGLTDRTIRNWKYRITFPREGVAKQVIDWSDRGKPMKKVLPPQTASDLL